MNTRECWQDDADAKYKKKSVHKPPKKSKHRHEYVACVFSAPCKDFSPGKGMVDAIILTDGTYCRICGKVGEVKIFHTEETDDGLLRLSDEARLQAVEKLVIDGAPTFTLRTQYGIHDKYVSDEEFVRAKTK